MQEIVLTEEQIDERKVERNFRNGWGITTPLRKYYYYRPILPVSLEGGFNCSCCIRHWHPGPRWRYAGAGRICR